MPTDDPLSEDHWTNQPPLKLAEAGVPRVEIRAITLINDLQMSRGRIRQAKAALREIFWSQSAEMRALIYTFMEEDDAALDDDGQLLELPPEA